MRGTHYQPARQQRRGFSLAELAIVLLIIGMFAGLAIPRFAGSISRQRVNAAANRIMMDLSLARRRAITTGASQTVQFTIATDSYTLPGAENPLARTVSAYVIKLSDPPYQTEVDSADFGGDEQVVFDGFGRADSGGTVVVHSGAHQKTITLAPQTGIMTAQ